GGDGFDVATWTGQARYGVAKLQWSLNSHRKTLPTGEFETLLGDGTTRQTDTRAMIEAKVDPKLGPNLQAITRAHANYYGYRGHFAHSPDGGGLEYSLFDGEWAGLEQRFVWTPIAPLRLTVGGEAQEHFRVHQYDEEDSPPTVLLDDRHD